MQVTLNANRPAQDDLGMTRSICRRKSIMQSIVLSVPIDT